MVLQGLQRMGANRRHCWTTGRTPTTQLSPRRTWAVQGFSAIL
jgi:hypothetical protein